jgi:hypothetical protein
MKNYNRPSEIWQGHRDPRRRRLNIGRERNPHVDIDALSGEAQKETTEHQPEVEAEHVTETEHIESHVEMVPRETTEPPKRRGFRNRRPARDTT